MAPVLTERNGPYGVAGAATAALFIGAVIGEFLTPWLMLLGSPARLMIVGQLLTAVASLAYLVPRLVAWQMVAAAGARGLGIGVAIVVSVALITELAAPSRLGRSIGYFGLAIGAPSIAFPSIGVSLLASGHSDVAVSIAFLDGLGGALVAWRWRRHLVAKVRVATNPLVAVRRPGLLALFVGFVLVSCSFGGVITYAPIVLLLDGFGSAAMFLLVSGASRTASRWLSGLIGDYQPARLILVSGVGLSAAGLVALATRGGPIAIMIAAAAYGTGYGAVQTGAYLAMTARGGSYSSSATSALWNIAIDLGGSVRGILIGLSAALYGYLNAVWAIPAVLLMSLPLFWWSRKLSSFPLASER